MAVAFVKLGGRYTGELARRDYFREEKLKFRKKIGDRNYGAGCLKIAMSSVRGNVELQGTDEGRRVGWSVNCSLYAPVRRRVGAKYTHRSRTGK